MNSIVTCSTYLASTTTNMLTRLGHDMYPSLVLWYLETMRFHMLF